MTSTIEISLALTLALIVVMLLVMLVYQSRLMLRLLERVGALETQVKELTAQLRSSEWAYYSTREEFETLQDEIASKAAVEVVVGPVHRVSVSRRTAQREST